MSTTTNNKGKVKTKTVKAMGYRWTVVENDVGADYGRGQLAAHAQRYVLGIKRPASRLGANQLLDYYADVISTVEKVEPIEPQDAAIAGFAFNSEGFIADLMSNPGLWVELTGQACRDSRAAEIDALWNAAKECNPQWYGADEDASTDVEEEDTTRLTDEERAEIDLAYAAIDVENPTGQDHPDNETLMMAASKTVAQAEKKATEAGKIGPATFPRTRKRK